VQRRALAAGIRPLKLHATRHTWATLAIASGKSVRWVADQLGHHSPEFTLRVYTHALRDEEPDLSFADFALGDGAGAARCGAALGAQPPGWASKWSETFGKGGAGAW